MDSAGLLTVDYYYADYILALHLLLPYYLWDDNEGLLLHGCVVHEKDVHV